MLLCLDVVQSQEVLDGWNELGGVESFHQLVKLVLVEIMPDHIRVLVLSLARMVDQASVAIFFLCTCTEWC